MIDFPLDFLVALCYYYSMIKYNKKLKPHYNLSKMQEYIRAGKLHITHTAIQNAQNDFNIKATDIPTYIYQLNNSHFYKSMTCDQNNKIWQDVYHLPIKTNQVAYIKLQLNIEEETVIIQFKRKE